ncbi:alpha-L-rhamnosidase [Flavobacteriaceae bacterium MAR_2010_188]|nr:alpha-L-rhamnosidase [Flavobacteriaceae bacterium MAR_2010_188]
MRILYLLSCLLLFGCFTSDDVEISNFAEIFSGSESISGKSEYLDSPYVTAGDRVYMVGHQDGSFPELGWHIKDEMGGIWNHPIKLMDGFEAEISDGQKSFKLNKAEKFTNYPFGNKHDYKLADLDLNVERWQYVPDNLQGVAIQYIIYNDSEEDTTIDFKFTGYSDLRPTWLGERTDMIDSQDESTFLREDYSCSVRDKKNSWFLKFGSDQKTLGYRQEENPYKGLGLARSMAYKIDISPKASKVITFVIAGSYTSKAEVNDNYEKIHQGISKNLDSKKRRFEKLANKSKLTIPDKKLEESFRWLKYNSDWLIQTVPEIGTGITAGIPDYPWWFGVDSEYALKGYMRIGREDAVKSTIKLLDSMSHVINGNGRIIHEMSTNGAVFNKGNINETPQFASLIWDIYQWNGDKDFLEKYYPTVTKGLTWLMEENDADKNLFPDGFGMMEIHGMDSEMIDVAAYTQKAFSDASKMAAEMGDLNKSKEYQKLAEKIKVEINKNFWSEEFQSYADFIGNDEQALKLIDDAIIRADTLNKPWAVEELTLTAENTRSTPTAGKRPFVLHHNWVVNTPLETKIADSIRAARALLTAEKFVNPFGVFVTGIDRDESAGTDEGSFKGSKSFSYTGAVMTLPTAVLIISENNYGRPDRALDYLKRMDKSFSYALPGSMYEVSPDYGMITQAWNIYGYAVPIVSQFFGIKPMASQKTITIEPQMPITWDKASLEDVEIGDNKISIFYEKTENKLNLKVKQTKGNWTLKIKVPKGKNYETFDEIDVNNEGRTTLFTSGLKETNIIIYY